MFNNGIWQDLWCRVELFEWREADVDRARQCVDTYHLFQIFDENEDGKLTPDGLVTLADAAGIRKDRSELPEGKVDYIQMIE